MMAMFDKYIVHGVKVEVWFAPPNPDGTSQPTMSGIIVGETDYNGVNLNAQTVLELANVTLSKNIMAPTESVGGAISSANNNEYITTYVNPAKLRGQTSSEYRADPNNAGTASANPANPMYITLTAGTIGTGVVATTAIRAAVRLTYDVEFFEPKQPPIS